MNKKTTLNPWFFEQLEFRRIRCHSARLLPIFIHLFQDSLNPFAVDSLPWFSAAPMRDPKTRKIGNQSPARRRSYSWGDGRRSSDSTDVMALWGNGIQMLSKVTVVIWEVGSNDNLLLLEVFQSLRGFTVKVLINVRHVHLDLSEPPNANIQHEQMPPIQIWTGPTHDWPPPFHPSLLVMFE